MAIGASQGLCRSSSTTQINDKAAQFISKKVYFQDE